MPRINYIKKNFLKKDTLYNSFLVNLLIVKTLKKGKKFLAISLIYKALNILQLKKKNALKLLELAIKNIRPRITSKELNPKEGTRTLIIPLDTFKSIRISIKWLIKNSLKRSKKSFSFNLANEIYDSAINRGLTIRQKKDYTNFILSKKTAF